MDLEDFICVYINIYIHSILTIIKEKVAIKLSIEKGFRRVQGRVKLEWAEAVVLNLSNTVTL